MNVNVDVDDKAGPVALVFGTILGVLIVAVTSPLWLPLVLLQGFVFAKLWLWFVVPLGVRALGVWHACGLLLLVGIARSRASDPNAAKLQTSTALIGIGLGALLTLALGWGAHWIMVRP